MTRLRVVVSKDLGEIYFVSLKCYYGFAESSMLCYNTNHHVADATDCSSLSVIIN